MIHFLALEPSAQGPLITAAGAVTVALTGVIVELLRRQKQTMSEVRDQVSNDHDTNLRDDLDRVIESLDRLLDGQHQHGRELRGLREEIAHERRERLAVAERLDDHIQHVKEARP
ncbi:DUF2746 domain-containing protein [Actinocorallia libanotica]|uniref:DUF2746 domain-containing protein n=1 Tax=Actinocorallia libanotica TaxID=46162 RepID=A0ABP4CFP4_9ACTN